MSRLVFRSIMAHDFEEFIRLKRNLGYKYTIQGKVRGSGAVCALYG